MEIKKTLFEKLFPRHIRDLRMRHDWSEVFKYIETANKRLDDFTICLFTSLAFVFMLFYIHFDLGGFKDKTILNYFLLCFLLGAEAIQMLLTLKDIDEETLGEKELAEKWKKVSIATASVLLILAAVSLYESGKLLVERVQSNQADILDYENIVEYEEYGIKITIPAGWSDIEWECRAEAGTGTINRFHVWNQNHTMWIYMQGYSLNPHTKTSDLKVEYDRYSSRYLDNGFISKPETVTINGIEVHKAIGRRKEFPGWIYIEYLFTYNGNEMAYTYRFTDDLKFDKEVAQADNMLYNFEFNQH